MSTSKTIVMKSYEDESFEVEEAVAMKSQTIKNMIEDDCAGNGIPLPNVSSKTLAKVIEYCKRQVEFEALIKNSDSETDKSSKEEDLKVRKSFDSEFIKVDSASLFDLILAANYLDIKDLLDLTTQAVADMIKDKSVEEVRTIFNIQNDFTEEEEQGIRQEHAWAFE